MIIGRHLIAGEWVADENRFTSDPVQGPGRDFAIGTQEHVDRLCEAAESAFWTYGYSSREQRAAFLNHIADEIEARAGEITKIGTEETGLPEARLQGERGRTTGQLRLFAKHILAGDYLDRRHDTALPDRQPLPRPDLCMLQRPIGPVAVFGASNFPLAFSIAGGDTAAALAAGCPVAARGHPAHPATAELVAQAIDAARQAEGIDPGVFGLIQGNTLEVGQALVQHPLIKAVAFTGSLGGGRALFDLCAKRAEPIPFFGELGSVNPVFLLPEALRNRGSHIAEEWAQSLTLGVGQFCTNPGIVIAQSGVDAEAFEEASLKALENFQPQTMLTVGIASSYRYGRDRIRITGAARELLGSRCEQREAVPYVFKTTGQEWLHNPVLAEEVFGPLGIIVIAKDADEMVTLANSLRGQLTCTLQVDEGDHKLAQRLMPILERKAGRVLANGFPTGVEVSDAMVHTGPYPASTNFGATSVGTLAIRRFLRPVCYQNMPEALLPKEVADG